MKLETFWVTTTESPGATIGDMVFESTPDYFVNQVRGGLNEEHKPMFFTTRAEAEDEAVRRLRQAAGRCEVCSNCREM